MEKLDQLLQEILGRIKKELEETEEYTREQYGSVPTQEEADIIEDLEITRELLEQIAPEVTGMESLDAMDLDDKEFLFECLAEYSSWAVVDERDAALKEVQEQELELLDQVLDHIQAMLPLEGLDMTELSTDQKDN